MKYANKIRKNGKVFTHIIEADTYKQALAINKKRKKEAEKRGDEIFGRLERA